MIALALSLAIISLVFLLTYGIWIQINVRNAAEIDERNESDWHLSTIEKIRRIELSGPAIRKKNSAIIDQMDRVKTNENHEYELGQGG